MKALRMGLLLAVALVSLCGARVEGGRIFLLGDFGNGLWPNVDLYHEVGGTDGYDLNNDYIYSTLPPLAVDFYSIITGYNLAEDVRGLDSISTYHTMMTPNGITGTANGVLNFALIDPYGDFSGVNIYSDIYKNGSLVLGGIDVRQYAKDYPNGTTVPLSLTSTDYYNIDVRFTAAPEPSTLTLLGIGAGALALGWWRRRRYSFHTEA